MSLGPYCKHGVSLTWGGGCEDCAKAKTVTKQPLDAPIVPIAKVASGIHPQYQKEYLRMSKRPSIIPILAFDADIGVDVRDAIKESIAFTGINRPVTLIFNDTVISIYHNSKVEELVAKYFKARGG